MAWEGGGCVLLEETTGARAMLVARLTRDREQSALRYQRFDGKRRVTLYKSQLFFGVFVLVLDWC